MDFTKPVVVTDDTAVLTARGYYYGARFTANSTAAGRAKIYDATNSTASNSTTQIDEIAAVQNGSNGSQLQHPVMLKNGLYVDMNAANPGKAVLWITDLS